MTKVVPPSPSTGFTGELQDVPAFVLNDIRLTDNPVFGQPLKLVVWDLEQVLQHLPVVFSKQRRPPKIAGLAAIYIPGKGAHRPRSHLGMIRRLYETSLNHMRV